jgi:hypothetical protein
LRGNLEGIVPQGLKPRIFVSRWRHDSSRALSRQAPGGTEFATFTAWLKATPFLQNLRHRLFQQAVKVVPFQNRPLAARVKQLAEKGFN